MKVASLLLLLLTLWLPCQAQTEEEPKPTLMHGYLFQNGITPESYVIENAEQMKAFVQMLPPTIPSKTVPAPPNTDPLLKGGNIDFENNLLVIAVGRNTISHFPKYLAQDTLQDGTRQITFSYTVVQSEAYPFGWAVYSAIILPRIDAPTRVKVNTTIKRSWPEN